MRAWISHVSPPPCGLVSNGSTPLCPNTEMRTVSNSAAVVPSPGLQALRYRPSLSAWLMEAPGKERSVGRSTTQLPHQTSAQSPLSLSCYCWHLPFGTQAPQNQRQRRRSDSQFTKFSNYSTVLITAQGSHKGRGETIIPPLHSPHPQESEVTP